MEKRMVFYLHKYDKIDLNNLDKLANTYFPRGVYFFMATVLSIGLISLFSNRLDYEKFYIILIVITLFLALVVILFIINEKNRKYYIKLMETINEINELFSNSKNLNETDIEKQASYYAGILFEIVDKKVKSYSREEWKAILISTLNDH